MARAFEDAAIEVLVAKTRKAITESDVDIKSLIVGGGVSANAHLARELEEMAKEFHEQGLTLLMPSRKLSTDNALMIGLAGYIKVKTEPEVLQNQEPIIAKGNLSL